LIAALCDIDMNSFSNHKNHTQITMIRSKKLEFLIVSLLFVAVVLIYSVPIVENWDRLGPHDWDLNFYTHGVTYVSLAEYSQFPLWNPYVCGGMTLVGNLIMPFFPPTFLLIKLFGFAKGIRLEFIIMLFVGMMGMYYLARHFKVSRTAALISSSIFALNGIFPMRFAVGHFSFLYVLYVPLILLFYLRSISAFSNIFAAIALMVMIMFSTGFNYVVPFTFLFMGIFSVLLSAQRQSFKPLLLCMFFGVMSILLAAPKVLPVIDTMVKYPRLTLLKYSVPLDCLYSIFIRSGQTINDVCTFSEYKWWEYGSYIGVGGAVLCFLGIILIRKQWPLIVTGVFFFLMSLGNVSKYSLWTILHSFPVFNNMRIPTRMMLFFIFPFAVLAGIVVDVLSRRLCPNKYVRNALVIILFCVLSWGYLKESANVLKDAFIPAVMKKEFNKTSGFKQVFVPPQFYKQMGNVGIQFFALMDNKGLVNGYENLRVERNAVPDGFVDYRGEYFLENKNGDIEMEYWSPNKLSYKYDVAKDDVLVINQNYNEGWRSSTGHKLLSTNGRLSVEIRSGRGRVEVYFLPGLFILGCIVSVAAFVALVLIGVLYRMHRTNDKAI